MTHSSFIIITPAEDLQLMTLDQMRATAGVPSNITDEDLLLVGLRVADAIMQECDIAIADAGEFPPTLMRERIEETFYDFYSTSTLLLSRRFSIAVNSIILDGAESDLSGFVVKSEAGMIERRPWSWLGSPGGYGSSYGGTAVVDYWAGFAKVPPVLTQAAISTMVAFWEESYRSTGIKRVEIPGVMTKEYWVSDVSEVFLPIDVKESLKRFRNGQV